MILKTTYLNGYADSKPPFTVRHNTTDVLKALEKIVQNLSNCFQLKDGVKYRQMLSTSKFPKTYQNRQLMH